MKLQVVVTLYLKIVIIICHDDIKTDVFSQFIINYRYESIICYTFLLVLVSVHIKQEVTKNKFYKLTSYKTKNARPCFLVIQFRSVKLKEMLVFTMLTSCVIQQNCYWSMQPTYLYFASKTMISIVSFGM